jgi:hypothetical protein
LAWQWLERRLGRLRMGPRLGMGRLGLRVRMAVLGRLGARLESLVVRPFLVCSAAGVFLLPGLQLGL